MSVVIEHISKEAIPKSLMLLADPSDRQIDAYVERGLTYVAKQEGRVVGVYVLLETRPKTMEIMNIAVVEYMQGKGIGKKLLKHAVETAKGYGMSKLEVGTGNSSVSQLALYQKYGFRIFLLILITFRSIMKKSLLKMGLYAVI